LICFFCRPSLKSDRVVSLLTMAMLTLQTDINEVNKEKKGEERKKPKLAQKTSFVYSSCLK